MDKWIMESDKALNTATWLYEWVNCEFVASLKSKVYIQFRTSSLAVETSVQPSSMVLATYVLQHSKTMQSLICITEYAPIAKALNTLDAATERRVRKKFEIVYCISKENMSFTIMDTICELEEQTWATATRMKMLSDQICKKSSHY